jgi:hypothetical protein
MLTMQTALRLRMSALIIAWLLAACSQDTPTAESSLEAARGASRGIVATEVPMLPGDDDAYANDVNSDGVVVGQSAASTDLWMKAYVVTASGPMLLSTPGLEGAAYGISEGPTPYVVGNDGGPTGVGVRWRLTNPISREELGGSPMDVNSSGTATGSQGGSVALWSSNGTATLIVSPAPNNVDGTGVGINESGHIVANYWRNDALGDARDTWVRAPDGRMVMLPPAPGDVSTYGSAISEVVGGSFHVSGSTYSASGTTRSARWTIDATSLAVGAPLVVATGSAGGVNRAGAVAGTQASRRTGTPYYWSNGVLQQLKLPRGGSDGFVRALSDGAGTAIVAAGTMKISNRFRAILWRIQ